jgi:hypothetical protein
MMNKLLPVLLCSLLPSLFAEELPPTFLTIRGKELARQDLAALPPLSADKPKGFASGFSGWRYSVDAKSGRSGSWNFADGAFHGMESPAANHPATASFGITYQDAVIQVEFRLNDVPLEGRKYRSVFVKATDEKDYVAAFFLSPSGGNLTAYSTEKINPLNKQRDKEPPVGVSQPLKMGQWYVAVLEIRGQEAVATVAGRSVTATHPLFGNLKHSVMLGVGVDASFRNLRVWEGLPNPEWTRNKETILAASKPAKK